MAEKIDIAKLKVEGVERIKKRWANRGPLERVGCFKFVLAALNEAGIETAGDDPAANAHHWRKIPPNPQPLDVVRFEWPKGENYLGLMLDRRRAIQSSDLTNGIAVVDIYENPWGQARRVFYRHKIFIYLPLSPFPHEPIPPTEWENLTPQSATSASLAEVKSVSPTLLSSFGAPLAAGATEWTKGTSLYGFSPPLGKDGS